MNAWTAYSPAVRGVIARMTESRHSKPREQVAGHRKLFLRNKRKNGWFYEILHSRFHYKKSPARNVQGILSVISVYLHLQPGVTMYKNH